jgi:hypothetical protein
MVSFRNTSFLSRSALLASVPPTDLCIILNQLSLFGLGWRNRPVMAPVAETPSPRHRQSDYKKAIITWSVRITKEGGPEGVEVWAIPVSRPTPHTDPGPLSAPESPHLGSNFGCFSRNQITTSACNSLPKAINSSASRFDAPPA